MVVVNFRIGEEVKFHDVLNSFRADRGAGTTSLEAKLLHQLTEMRKEVLYEVFLGLWKAYEAFER